MIDNLRNGNIVMISIVIIAIFTVVLLANKNNTHTDCVIKTATEEFIVNGYSISNDKQCVYFTYDGHERTVCGNYEIIE